MSLKSLIQWLLDSRTTPEEAGHSAMPSSAPTTISSPTSITSWGTITTFTAPDDGYVTFRGRSMEGAAAQIASLPLENNPTVITATQDNYQGMSCNLPVVKGKTVEVYGSNIENIVVSFNRLIGGGYRRIVWRAQLCLRALSNYLPKVISRAKSLGFLKTLSDMKLLSHPSLKRRRQVSIQSRTQRLQTACYLLGMAGNKETRTLTHAVQKSTALLNTSYTAQVVGRFRTAFMLQKEIQSLLNQLRRQSYKFASTLQSSLREGGALC